MNVDGCTGSCPCRPSGWHTAWKNLSIGLVVLNLWACSALDLLGDPKMSDLQLTIDVLHGSLNDAQRTMAELRAEVELRNQELAETQVIRAQLEGRVRETEHRLSEARHVINLQREELAESRADRERIARTDSALQSQIKQLRKQLSRVDKQASGGIAPTVMDLPIEKPLRSVPIDMKAVVSFDGTLESRRVHSPLDAAMSGATLDDRGAVLAQPVPLAAHSRVTIKHGDTLWSLAQRYHTSVYLLMTANALSSDYIRAGQSLWLPESVAEGSEYERR